MGTVQKGVVKAKRRLQSMVVMYDWYLGISSGEAAGLIVKPPVCVKLKRVRCL